MKYLIVLFWTLLTALPLHAETPQLIPQRQGYALDNPRVLAQQRLFGLAHGITLLAAACVREPGNSEALTLAYAAWNEMQAAAIDASLRDLARFYFGDRATEATRLDIERALKLRDKLSIKPGSKGLREACATFAEALQKPRYDLRAQFHLQFLAARLEAATATEAETGACRSLLDNDDLARLDQAMGLWRATYGAGVEEARTTLEKHWPELRLDASFDGWLSRAQETGRKAAVTERCKTVPARLLTRKLDPDDAFNTDP